MKKRPVLNTYFCGGCGKKITSDGLALSELVYWPPTRPKPLCIRCAPSPGPSLKETHDKLVKALDLLKQHIKENP